MHGELPLSTHCADFRTIQDGTAVDPKQPLGEVAGTALSTACYLVPRGDARRWQHWDKVTYLRAQWVVLRAEKFDLNQPTEFVDIFVDNLRAGERSGRELLGLNRFA